jgi:hypothetical protein
MIELTLAVNLQAAKMGSRISLFLDKIVGIIELPNTGTIVLGAGGVTIPVTESKEQILTSIKNAKDKEIKV